MSFFSRFYDFEKFPGIPREKFPNSQFFPFPWEKNLGGKTETLILLCQTQEKIPMKLANQFSLMPICNFTVAVANHSCYSRRIVRIVWQRDELVMRFETAFAMICMDYHLFICRRESTFAFSFRSFS